jgi:hypothetical protein
MDGAQDAKKEILEEVLHALLGLVDLLLGPGN